MKSVFPHLSSSLIGVLASGSVMALEVDGVITIEFGSLSRHANECGSFANGGAVLAGGS